MITYHYSIIEDLKAHWSFLRSWKWLRKNNIVIIYPNPLNVLRVAFGWWFLKRPRVEFRCDKDIHCYWVSAGNWGSYLPPNKIWICPIRHRDIERTVKHEVTHIIYEDDVKVMSHLEKEAYIESRESSW